MRSSTRSGGRVWIRSPLDDLERESVAVLGGLEREGWQRGRAAVTLVLRLPARDPMRQAILRVIPAGHGLRRST